MPRHGCRARRSPSLLTITSAPEASASSRYLLSFASRHSVHVHHRREDDTKRGKLTNQLGAQVRVKEARKLRPVHHVEQFSHHRLRHSDLVLAQRAAHCLVGHAAAAEGGANERGGVQHDHAGGGVSTSLRSAL